ncbi:hypothetical protein RB199_30450 [Streptomyces libani]|uniref:Uncharacterized protein n=1 Tax=Streptomyces nigrescens TaxID=1920 RepID=A0ABY7JCV8_STRNI|nr:MULTISPECIES: hypothetical protein [Streptomyces]WAU07852.1 hypothetical protein STRNI_006496 [Streptomyces nigrescens]WDT54349.1 hypothetical protein NUT86_09970 [Streptomyces sp. G7(2002)]
MVVSTVSDDGKFWSGLKKAHAQLPKGATWKLAVASRDGAKAVNILTHDSLEGVRDFFEAHAGAYATTEYFEADAANAIGLPR